MTKRLNDQINAIQAVAPATVSPGGMTGIAINATGASRARFVFNFGANSGTTAALSAGLGVWQAATSGGTYATVTSLAAVTSGVLGGNVMVVDVPVSSASPWLKVSGGSVLSTSIVASAVCELYDYVYMPPTSTAQQVVVA